MFTSAIIVYFIAILITNWRLNRIEDEITTIRAILQEFVIPDPPIQEIENTEGD